MFWKSVHCGGENKNRQREQQGEGMQTIQIGPQKKMSDNTKMADSVEEKQASDGIGSTA